MLNNIIDTLSLAFGRVINLVGDVFEGGFEAVGTLSSELF